MKNQKNENRREFLKRTVLAFAVVPILTKPATATFVYVDENDEWFENKLKPRLIRITQKYREFSENRRQKIIALIDKQISVCKDEFVQDCLVNLRQTLLSIQ